MGIFVLLFLFPTLLFADSFTDGQIKMDAGREYIHFPKADLLLDLYQYRKLKMRESMVLHVIEQEKQLANLSDNAAMLHFLYISTHSPSPTCVFSDDEERDGDNEIGWW